MAEIISERLVLRPPAAGDAAMITQLMQDRDLPWNLGRAPWPYTRKDAEEWLALSATQWAAGTEFPFIIRLRADDEIIGSCGITHVTQDVWEMGYWLGKAFWGKGYVTEAARSVLDWARREKGCSRFISGHIEDNPASGRVLQKLGFEPVGKATHYVRARDCEVTADRYVMNAPAEIALGAASHYKRPGT